MEEGQFQVTLPSNVSAEYFPKNKPNNYTTKFPSSFKLEGEWEAALVDIQYPFPNFNWRHSMNIGLGFHGESKKNIESSNIAETSMDLIKFSENYMRGEYVASITDRYTVSIYTSNLRDTIIEPVFINEIALFAFGPVHGPLWLQPTSDIFFRKETKLGIKYLQMTAENRQRLEYFFMFFSQPEHKRVFQVTMYSHFSRILHNKESSPELLSWHESAITEPERPFVLRINLEGNLLYSSCYIVISEIVPERLFPATDFEKKLIYSTDRVIFKMESLFSIFYLSLRPAFYESISEFSSALSKQIENVAVYKLGFTKEDVPSISYNQVKDRIEICKGKKDCVLFADSLDLFQGLGINIKRLANDPLQFFYYPILKDMQISEGEPTFDFNTVMFVYSDNIEYQIVGDIQAPLLAVIPIRGEMKTQCYWACIPPFYLPVPKLEFDTLNIRICTDMGEDFPFPRNGKVICRLHFRKRHTI